ncbi:MAG: HRDC domain-containing protein, partial [Sphingomonadaceae bacterium]
DVTYLAQLFPKMLDRLRNTGRGDWLDQEMDRLGDPASYLNVPDLAWMRIKAPSRRPEVLGRLKVLAAWREREAQHKNIPRGRIVKDETLADLAGHPPVKQADLARVRGLSAAWAQNDIGQRLMSALEQAEPLTEAEMPLRDDRKPGLGKEASLIADLLKLLLKVRSREADVAPKLIARGEDLEAIAGGQRDGLGLLSGWRYDVFGKDALALVEGRLAFSVRDGRMVMTEIGSGGQDDR